MKQNNILKYILYSILGFFGLAFLLVIAGVFILVVSLGTSDRERQQKAAEDRPKRTAETVGTITKYESSRATGKTYNNHYITYRFYVGKESYSGTVRVDNGHPSTHAEGKQVKVCYEPSKPENAQVSLPPENQICGQ